MQQTVQRRNLLDANRFMALVRTHDRLAAGLCQKRMAIGATRRKMQRAS